MKFVADCIPQLKVQDAEKQAFKCHAFHARVVRISMIREYQMFLNEADHH